MMRSSKIIEPRIELDDPELKKSIKAGWPARAGNGDGRST
jgi:hypothetical protein